RDGRDLPCLALEQRLLDRHGDSVEDETIGCRAHLDLDRLGPGQAQRLMIGPELYRVVERHHRLRQLPRRHHKVEPALACRGGAARRPEREYRRHEDTRRPLDHYCHARRLLSVTATVRGAGSLHASHPATARGGRGGGRTAGVDLERHTTLTLRPGKARG